MAKLRAVIFDIGRVLVRVDIQGVKSALAQGLPLSPEELWSAIEKDPRWPDWQEGRISPRDWHLHLCKRFQSFLEVRRIHHGLEFRARAGADTAEFPFRRISPKLQARLTLQYRSHPCGETRIQLRLFRLFSEGGPHLFLRGRRQQTGSLDLSGGVASLQGVRPRGRLH